MKSTDSEPRFIEQGDDQDECLALPLYVTRQVDDEIRILKTIRQSCAGYTSQPRQEGNKSNKRW